MFVLQNGHERPIHRIVVSTDGSKLASGAHDGTVRVWDLRAGLLLRKFVTAGFFVHDLSISADGKRLAYYAPDGTPDGLMVQVLDLDDPRSTRRTSPYHGAFQLSPDGLSLVMAADKLTFVDTRTGKKTKEVALGAKAPSALALAHDAEGKHVAAAYPGELLIVDVAKSVVTHRIPVGSALGETPLRVALTADVAALLVAGGTITLHPLTPGAAPRVLAGRYKDMSASKGRIWATELMKGTLATFTLPDGQPVPLSSHELPRGDLVAASRDGSTIVTARSHLAEGMNIEVRDVQTMRAVRTIEGTVRSIESLTVRPDGSELVTGSFRGDLLRWDLGTGSPKPAVPQSERNKAPIRTLSYAPSGEQFASSTNAWRVRVHEAASGRITRQWDVLGGSFVRYAEFLPSSDELLTVRVRTDRKLTSKKGPGGMPVIDEKHDVAVERWDLRGPRPPLPKAPLGEIARPQGKLLTKLASDPWFFALSKDGARLVVGGGEALTSLRTDTGRIDWTTKLPTVPIRLAKRPDGGLEVNQSRATFSPDGKTIVLSTRKLLTRAGVQQFVPMLLEIDANTGRARKEHEPGTHGPVRWHKATIVVGGLKPAVLDARDFSVRARLTLADNKIDAIEVHPKRDLFLLGGDGGATSFVTERGEVVMTLVSTPNGEWVAAAPSGAYRSSLDGARSIAWTFPAPLESFSFERFASQFERPELVERSLAGESAAAPTSLARPPRLRVETKGPRGRIETAEKNLSLDVVATSPSRVDRVRVFVDGKPAGDRLVCAAEGRVSLDVPLHAGRNRVSLVAYDAAGYASNPEQLDVVSTSPDARKPSLHVVAIGVSRYPNMLPDQQLDYADDDARSVAASLARLAGPQGPFERIEATTLLDEEVTVRRVDEALAGLSPMRPDDLAVVFFAGHGARIDETKMLFLTSHASFTRAAAIEHGIGWDRIEKALQGARGRVLMMLDACHAGHVTTEVIAPNEALARELAAGERAGVLVFSAARGSQFSFEVPPADASGGSSRGLELAWEGKPPPKQEELKGGHGLFTAALLEALDGEAPDRDRSGAIEVNELVDYVTERVHAASNGMQTPWVARREMFGEFMIAPAAR